MFLFILATLIIGSVHTLSVGYPQSTHGDFPTQGSFVQGSIRCLDKNGEERVISYIYKKPVASQVYYTGGSSTPYERAFEQQQQQQHHHHHHHYQGNQPVQADGHYTNTAHTGFTPEVQRARQEHFKLFNEIKSNVEHKQQQIRQYHQQQHQQIEQFQQQQHRQIVRFQEQQRRQLQQDPMDVNREDYFDNCEQW